MTGSPQPLLFGYLRVRLLAPGITSVEIVEQFEAYARTEGYALGTVFIDQAHTAPAGFDALIEAVKQHEVRAIAVPTLDHLAVLGKPPPLTEFLQRTTGAQVFVMDP